MVCLESTLGNSGQEYVSVNVKVWIDMLCFTMLILQRLFVRRTMISFGGSGSPFGSVLKSVYAPGASSMGIPDGGPALRCFALTVTLY